MYHLNGIDGCMDKGHWMFHSRNLFHITDGCKIVACRCLRKMVRTHLDLYPAQQIPQLHGDTGELKLSNQNVARSKPVYRSQLDKGQN